MPASSPRSTIRGDPACDLRSRVETELVEDVSDVGGDCSLGNEQPACDLLVAEAFRDQTRDLEFPLRERSGVRPRKSNVLGLLGFTERQSHCRVAVQVFPRLKLRLELRRSEGSRRRLSGLGLEWRMRANDLGAGTGANRLCCSEQ